MAKAEIIVTEGITEVPQKVMPDGSIHYGEVRVPLAPGSCFIMGNEWTRWRILKVDEKTQTALVLAEKEIGNQAYHKQHKEITWADCDLRAWLNGEYYEKTFSDEEKEAILACDITTPDNAHNGTIGGADTRDKIWLLSIDEAKEYFKGSTDRATGSEWWLRSPGIFQNHAINVKSSGIINGFGDYVYQVRRIRPACLIDLNSSFFKSLLSMEESDETMLVTPELVIKNGVLITVDPMIKDVKLPSFVTEIPGEIFCDAKSLRSIVIPKSVRKVRQYAFAKCPKLEEIIVENETLKFEKNAFGGGTDQHKPQRQFPCKMKNIFDLGLHLAMEDYRDIILSKGTWQTLRTEQQAKLFVLQQSDPLKKIYKSLLTEKNSDGLAEQIAKGIRNNYSTKECNAVAFFMTEFTDLISVAVAKAIYAKLKECKNAEAALKTIEACESVMALINASETGELMLTQEAQVLRDALQRHGLSKRALEKQLKDYFHLTNADLPEILYQDGTKANADVLAFLLVVHSIWNYSYEDAIKRFYHQLGIKPEVQPVLNLLDQNSFMAALKSLADQYLVKYQNSKKQYLCYPICRYADEELMKELTKRAPGWKTSLSGVNASPLWVFRKATLYSDTKSAIIFADKMHDLDRYAKIRGMSEDDFRDKYLSDIGLDENGRKEYDLGSQKVYAVLQKDLSFLIETADGKTMKSVPKKGSDADLYEAASADFKNIKSQAKKIVKNRAGKLFEDFLSGAACDAESWKRAYLENQLLRSVAAHIIWSQGENTFIVSGKRTIDAYGDPYELKKTREIKVAHPIEMSEESVLAWQEYLKTNEISQPFEQIWEPAYKESEIQEDRYKGRSIFWRRVQNADKHGIHFYEENYYNIIRFTLDDCELEHELDGQGRHWVDNDAVFELGKFKVNKFTRKANHIIYLFDKWTIWERIRKDDITVMSMLDHYNVAQISEFINIAVENQATQLSAALLAYKDEKFKEYDVFDEFVLEW